MTLRQATIASLLEAGHVDIQTGPFGTQLKASDYVEDGIPVINVRNIGYGNLREEKLEYVPEAIAERLSVHRLRDRDIIFGRKGAVDRHLFAGPEHEGWVQGSDCIRLRVSGGDINPRYLSYVFLREQHKQWMLTQCGNKATMASLNQDVIKRISFPVLPPAEQERITDLLSKHDDLIANNERRIALLERSARLLFEEWFIRLRYPGCDPNEVHDGVPTGWRRSSIGDVCRQFVDGDWLETKDQGGSDFRILQISNIGDNSFVETGNYRYISEETFRRLGCTEVVPDDILISRMPEPIGRAWLVTMQDDRMVTAVDVTVARPDEAQLSRFYLLYHLNSEPHISRCKTGATGATRPRVAKRVMASLPILVPDSGVQTAFDDIVEPMHRLRANLFVQTMKLKRARDFLLPRLMDGRVAV